MAGSKTQSAAKKKSSKQSDTDAGELARLQKHVAKAYNHEAGALVRYVRDLCTGSSSRLVVQAGLYLLIRHLPEAKAGGSKEKSTSPEVVSLLQQLLQQTIQPLKAAAAADDKKPSIILPWLVSTAMARLVEVTSLTKEQQQTQFGPILECVQQYIKTTDADRWLEQWQNPLQEFPATADVEELAKQNPQQLTRNLSQQLVNSHCAVSLRLQGGMDATARGLWASIKQLDKAAANKAQVQQQMNRTVSPTPPSQQQQQGKRSKDTDKVQDAKRGKAGDGRAAEELKQHQDMVKAAQERASKVVEMLSDATLGAKASSQQEHLKALQACVCVTTSDVKGSLSLAHQARGAVGGAKAGKDSKAAEAKADPVDTQLLNNINDLLKEQFGLAQALEQPVLQQLGEVVDQGLCVVYAGDASEDVPPKAGTTAAANSKCPSYFTSLQAFKQHVEQQHLTGPPATQDINRLGLTCHTLAPDLLSAYNGDFGDLLRDEAAAALMSSRKDKGVANGYSLGANPILQAFAEDCPLKQYLYHQQRVFHIQTEDPAAQTNVELAARQMAGTSLQSTALGFALLQLQRGAVVFEPEELSYAASWVVKAYYSLRLLMPLNNTCVAPHHLDFVLYYYYMSSSAELVDEVSHMLDPDLHQQEHAAAASKQGGAGSSSSPSEVPFSDGLVQDTITLLHMLHEAQALADSPLQLALQVYCHKVTGRALPLPHKQRSQLKQDDLANALGPLPKQNQLELRSFLLQALSAHYARLPAYHRFLDHVVDKRYKHRLLSVVQQGKGNDKKLALSPDYYAQVCMAAAMPYRLNERCCYKHGRQRLLAEREGRTFDKYAVENPDDYGCFPEGTEGLNQLSASERAQEMERYLLQPSRVVQAQQEQGLQPGTPAALEALTKEFFLGHDYEDEVPIKPPAPVNRGGWELTRLYLLLASQLSWHRQQLYEMVNAHEEKLQRGLYDSHGSQNMKNAERAVLQQRVAGLMYCSDTWCKWHEETVARLNSKRDEKLKASKDDKPGGKGAKDSRDTQQSKDLKAELDQLHAEIEKLNNIMAALETAKRTLVKQAEMSGGLVDAMITSTTQPDLGMEQTLELLVRELLNPRPAPEPLLEGRLRKALSLSRQMLFELDVTISSYINHAHGALLATMWRHRQPAAAVLLLKHALRIRLVTEQQEKMVRALLEAEEETAASTKAAGKASSKKKKKKGPAMQPKQVRVVVESEEEPSEPEQQEPAAAESEAEEEAAQQNGEPDVASLINPRFLSLDEEELPAPSPASSSSRRASAQAAEAEAAAAAAAAARAAAAAAVQKPSARPAAVPPEQRQPPARLQQQDRQQQQQQQQGKASRPGGRGHIVEDFWLIDGPLGPCVFLGRDGGATCWQCGEVGHFAHDCPLPHCPSCDRVGHTASRCREACRYCGRVHSGLCMLKCVACHMFGHLERECFKTQCRRCGRYGHMGTNCTRCGRCGNDHDPNAKPCCTRCKQVGHSDRDCTARQCSVCKQWGTRCVVGHCVTEEARAAEAAAASRAGRRGGPGAAAAQQQGSSRGSAAAAAAAAAASSPGAAAAVPRPNNVQLLGGNEVLRMPSTAREEFIGRLLQHRQQEVQDFASELVCEDRQDKFSDLMRVPPDVMAQWLQQNNAVQYLKDMLQHFEKTKGKASSGQQQEQPGGRAAAAAIQQAQQQQQQGRATTTRPADLTPDAAAAFEDALGPELFAGWRECSWGVIKDRYAPRGGPSGKFTRFKNAKAVAIDMTIAAAGPAYQPGSRPGSSSSSAAAAAGQQQQQQQQHSVEPSGPDDAVAGQQHEDGFGSDGIEDVGMQMAPNSAAQQQQQPQQRMQPYGQQHQQHGDVSDSSAAAAAAAAAAASRSGPAQGALAAVLQQRIKGQQQQQQGSSAGGAQPLPPHMQQQQLPHVLPGRPVAELQRHVSASNSYSGPHVEALEPQQQQQQQPGLPGPSPEAEARIISNEPMAPWMLWHKAGAFRAIHEFVADVALQGRLTMSVQEARSSHTDAKQLAAILVEVLTAAPPESRNDEKFQRLEHLARMLRKACDAGPPAYFLAHEQQQQLGQGVGMQPPGAAAAMLPPHLRHVAGLQQAPAGQAPMPAHLYGQQQLQQQQPGYGAPQQQQGDESESDDEESMLALLVPDAEQPAAQPGFGQPAAAADGHPSSWLDVTGQHMDEDSASADFPPLGGQPGAAAEDADMARALAASRVDQQYTSSSRTVPGVSVAGLANQAGEYNCFLNVVVQCLWSCRQFKQQVRQMGDFETDNPVVQALLRLFNQMEVAESGWQPGHDRAVINPSELRIALASHTPFKCQEMNDANELLDTIYECFAQAQHPGREQGSRGVVIDGVFGLLLTERVVCQACGLETHKVPAHYEHLIVVNSASLNLAAMTMPDASMDHLLAFLFAQETKFCDKDVGGCGEPNPRYRELVIGPQVLTLQLVWDQQVSSQEIRETLGHMEEDLDITAMYDDMQVASTTFRLTSAVAYYGQHYMAFVFNNKLNSWLMFDDASVSEVGSWQDVINKCGAGRIQPGVLFYQLVDLASLPNVARPAAAAAQHPPARPPAVARHSSSSADMFAGPGSPAHMARPHGAAAAGHGFGPPAAQAGPPAAAAAASAPPPRALPSGAVWGQSQPRVAAQQPQQHPAAAAAATGPPPGAGPGNAWGQQGAAAISAAAGVDPGSVDLAPRAYTAEADSWGEDATVDSAWAVPDDSSSFSSASGPASTAGRPSSSDTQNAWGAPPTSSSSHLGRAPHAGTGPAAAGGGRGPAAVAMRAILGPQGGGARSTGPQAAGNSLGPRTIPGSGGPLDRSSGSGGFSDRPGPHGRGGGDAGMRGGRVGGRGTGPSTRGTEAEGWSRGPGRGEANRGRGYR